jgi:hypothetical protein
VALESVMSNTRPWPASRRVPCPSEAAYRRELREGGEPHEACREAMTRAASARRTFRQAQGRLTQHGLPAQRWREVIIATERGLTVAAIAVRLAVSERTVQRYLEGGPSMLIIASCLAHRRRVWWDVGLETWCHADSRPCDFGASQPAAARQGWTAGSYGGRP